MIGFGFFSSGNKKSDAGAPPAPPAPPTTGTDATDQQQVSVTLSLPTEEQLNAAPAAPVDGIQQSGSPLATALPTDDATAPAQAPSTPPPPVFEPTPEVMATPEPAAPPTPEDHAVISAGVSGLTDRIEPVAEPAASTPSELPTLDLAQFLNQPAEVTAEPTSSEVAPAQQSDPDSVIGGMEISPSWTPTFSNQITETPATPTETEAPAAEAAAPEPIAAPTDTQPEPTQETPPTEETPVAPAEEPAADEEVKDGEDALPQAVTQQVQTFLNQNLDQESQQIEQERAKLEEREKQIEEQRSKIAEMQRQIEEQQAQIQEEERKIEHERAVWEHRKARVEEALKALQ